MRTFIKIILSLVILIVASVIMTLMAQASGTKVAPYGFIISAIVAWAILGVWKYKPKKNNNTDLDKTI